jgi:hypothetical protein
VQAVLAGGDERAARERRRQRDSRIGEAPEGDNDAGW